MSKIPDKGTSEWKKNETIINNNSALKQARDIAEGIEKPAHKYTSAGGGTGRLTTGANSDAYKDGWDRIFGNRDTSDDL